MMFKSKLMKEQINFLKIKKSKMMSATNKVQSNLVFNKLDGTSTFCLSYPKIVITKKDTNLIKNQLMFFFCSLLAGICKNS